MIDRNKYIICSNSSDRALLTDGVLAHQFVFEFPRWHFLLSYTTMSSASSASAISHQRQLWVISVSYESSDCHRRSCFVAERFFFSRNILSLPFSKLWQNTFTLFHIHFMLQSEKIQRLQVEEHYHHTVQRVESQLWSEDTDSHSTQLQRFTLQKDTKLTTLLQSC